MTRRGLFGRFLVGLAAWFVAKPVLAEDPPGPWRVAWIDPNTPSWWERESGHMVFVGGRVHYIREGGALPKGWFDGMRIVTFFAEIKDKSFLVDGRQQFLGYYGGWFHSDHANIAAVPFGKYKAYAEDWLKA